MTGFLLSTSAGFYLFFLHSSLSGYASQPEEPITPELALRRQYP